MATEISLIDWNNEEPITYLWICGASCPAGRDFRHDLESEDEDYCDFRDLELLEQLWHLVGTVDENGTWCWNGEADVTDQSGNTIWNVKARR